MGIHGRVHGELVGTAGVNGVGEVLVREGVSVKCLLYCDALLFPL